MIAVVASCGWWWIGQSQFNGAYNATYASRASVGSVSVDASNTYRLREIRDSCASYAVRRKHVVGASKNR